MTDLEKRIKAKIPGPDTGIEIRRTMCDICSPGMHCGINAYVKMEKSSKSKAWTDIPLTMGDFAAKGLQIVSTFTGKIVSKLH